MILIAFCVVIETLYRHWNVVLQIDFSTVVTYIHFLLQAEIVNTSTILISYDEIHS